MPYLPAPKLGGVCEPTFTGELMRMTSFSIVWKCAFVQFRATLWHREVFILLLLGTC